MLFNSFYRQDTEGFTNELKATHSESSQVSSDACLPAPSPHTFCCLNDTLGEGGQKVASSVRTTQWKTLQLFHFIPLDP